MRFFWDMDGVLYDFKSRFEQAMPGVNMKDDNTWTWEELHANDPHAYLMGNELPGIREVFDFAATKGENYILTAIPRRWNWPHATTHKRMWVMDNFKVPAFRVRFGPFAVDKQHHVEYSDDVLIDDMERNIKQWNRMGGIGILHKSPEETLEQIKRL